MEVEGDTGAGSLVRDHAYEAPEGKPWGLCIHCNLSEATHAEAKTPYAKVMPRERVVTHG